MLVEELSVVMVHQLLMEQTAAVAVDLLMLRHTLEMAEMALNGVCMVLVAEVLVTTNMEATAVQADYMVQGVEEVILSMKSAVPVPQASSLLPIRRLSPIKVASSATGRSMASI
jgi:hypothetical protein